MEVSASKSSSPHTRGSFGRSRERGTVIPVSPTTNILGLIVDRGVTFRPHSQEVIARAKPRLHVMKALTSTTFGHQKEAQAALYKQFVRPVLEYASPAWCTDLAPHKWRRSNAPRTQPFNCDGLRLIHTHPTPPRGVQGSPLEGADRHEGGAVLRWGHQRGIPLLPPTQPHSHQPQPAHHTCVSSFTALHSSISPTPLGRNHSSWIHQHTVSSYIESAPQNSLLGEPPSPSDFGGRTPPAQGR